MKKIRIESIGVSPPLKYFRKKGSLSHAVKAGKRCLKSSTHHQKDVQVLLNSGIYRDEHYAEPAFSTFIQKKLGINIQFQGNRTLSFDLQNGGNGMLTGIQVVANLISSGRIQTGMVISSETNPDKIPDPHYLYKNSGAAVMLDSSENSQTGFGIFVFKSFEKYIDLYSSFVSLTQKYGHLFIKKKKELEEAYLECVQSVIKEVLDKENLKADDISFVFPSQISEYFLSELPKQISFSAEKIINLSLKYGDTLTTSVFLSLKYLLDKKVIQPGQKVILLTVGAGITVGAAIYSF
ncbi:3-oxoacyl-ACP synthase III family protein [Acidobacteriota bacterium]